MHKSVGGDPRRACIPPDTRARAHTHTRTYIHTHTHARTTFSLRQRVLRIPPPLPPVRLCDLDEEVGRKPLWKAGYRQSHLLPDPADKVRVPALVYHKVGSIQVFVSVFSSGTRLSPSSMFQQRVDDGKVCPAKTEHPDKVSGGVDPYPSLRHRPKGVTAFFAPCWCSLCPGHLRTCAELQQC